MMVFSPAGARIEGASRCSSRVGFARLHASSLFFLERTSMLHYAIVFFVIAVIAALFGFGGIAAGAVGIAKILFFVFLVLALVSLVAGLVKRS
jgi:uncharacterized membrane protein YtjA (UPF0391 family)